MRNRIIEVTGQCPRFQQISRSSEAAVSASYPYALFWLQVYPPLGDRPAPVSDARMLCPWSMAAELDDTQIPADRRARVMDALKNGLKTIRQYDLPPNRILFAEDHVTRQISVWVD